VGALRLALQLGALARLRWGLARAAQQLCNLHDYGAPGHVLMHRAQAGPAGRRSSGAG